MSLENANSDETRGTINRDRCFQFGSSAIQILQYERKMVAAASGYSFSAEEKIKVRRIWQSGSFGRKQLLENPSTTSSTTQFCRYPG
jgi:hypothetical protein